MFSGFLQPPKKTYQEVNQLLEMCVGMVPYDRLQTNLFPVLQG